MAKHPKFTFDQEVFLRISDEHKGIVKKLVMCPGNVWQYLVLWSDLEERLMDESDIQAERTFTGNG